MILAILPMHRRPRPEEAFRDVPFQKQILLNLIYLWAIHTHSIIR